jgi:hypothetical protein
MICANHRRRCEAGSVVRKIMPNSLCTFCTHVPFFAAEKQAIPKSQIMPVLSIYLKKDNLNVN